VPTGADATHNDENGNENGNETRLYVNDECSKCRSALSILDERGIDAEHIRYLEEPPTVTDLRELMEMLGTDDPRAMMRTGESVYAELGLEGASPDQLLDAIATHPILLERPIFVVGDKAVIARPPERLLELL
jgi:arsenate reductase